MTDSVTIRQQHEALHQQGFGLLPAVIDPPTITELREAIDRLEPIHWDYQGLVDDHYTCVFNRSPFWLRFLDLPGVIELAEAALGTDCHIIGQTSWRSRPGFIGGELHADYLAMELPESLLADPAGELPVQVGTGNLYLDDIDAEPPRRAQTAAGRYPVARPRGRASAVQGRRRAAVSQRPLARGQPQPQRRAQPLPAADPLRPTHGGAEVLALPALPFQSRGAGRRHTAPAPPRCARA